MLSHDRFPVFRGPFVISAYLLAASAWACPNATFAQEVRARQVGSIVEMRGSCDASAVVTVPQGRLDALLVANDENEQLRSARAGWNKTQGRERRSE
jgi:hypothetical protein